LRRRTSTSRRTKSIRRSYAAVLIVLLKTVTQAPPTTDEGTTLVMNQAVADVLNTLDRAGYVISKREEVPAVFSAVLHRCDNPPCFNPEHLFLGTQVDNLADMRAKGRNVTIVSNLRPGAGAGMSPRDPLTGRYYKKETS
jgi:hypothetical protein